MSFQAYLYGSKFLISQSINVLHGIRLLYWYNRALKVYTKTSFENNSKDFISFDDVDISGKTFVIFGATSVVGKEVVKWIMKKNGVTCYAVCHDKSRGEDLKQSILNIQSSSSNFIIDYLDMAEPKEVETYINNFINEQKKVDVLINFASLFLNHEEKNKCGFNTTFAVNVLSSYLIIIKFSEYMAKTSDAKNKKRIISGICGDVLTVNIRVNNIELKDMTFSPTFSHSHERKQLAVIMENHSRKYPDIFFGCVIPGWVDSPRIREANVPLCQVRRDFRTNEQGADSFLWLAISNEALKYPSGKTFLDRKIEKVRYMEIPNIIKDTAESIYFNNLNNALDKSLM